MRNFLFILVAFLTLGVSAQQKTFNSDVKINGELKLTEPNNTITIQNTTAGENKILFDTPVTNSDYYIKQVTTGTNPFWSSSLGFGISDGVTDTEFFKIESSLKTTFQTGVTFNGDVLLNNVLLDFTGGGGLGSLTSNTLTGNRSWGLPDASGNIALFSDIPDASTTSYNFGGVVSWGPAPGGKTTLQLGNSSSHNINHFAGSIGFSNTTGDNLITLTNDNYPWGYTILTSNSLTQNESLTLPSEGGTLALTSDIPSYAEGTFTPTLTDTGAGATYSGTMQGEYIRTGNLVNFNIALSGLSTSGTPTGFLQIGNLPFVVDNLSVGSAACPVNQLEGIDVDYYSAVGSVIDSSDAIRIVITTSASSEFVTLSSATFTSGIIVVSGTYKTNVYTP